MRPAFPKYNDASLDELAQKLGRILVNISLDNMSTIVVTGTTASSANTSAKFRHALGHAPSWVLILEGNAYVAYNGVGVNDVDIRSSGTSQQFKALVVK